MSEPKKEETPNPYQSPFKNEERPYANIPSSIKKEENSRNLLGKKHNVDIQDEVKLKKKKF